MTFFIISHHWQACWYHVIPMAPPVASLNSLAQDDRNEVQHDFFGHMTPLALMPALHDADSIVNGTIPFLL